MRRLLPAALVVLALGTPVASAARLAGTRGDDRIVGTPRADRIAGRAGDDDLRGRGGGDRIAGGPGSDLVAGDAGNDRLDGGPGIDVLLGGAGNDVIIARDGTPDRITCGSGRDRVTADTIDVVARDCEKVKRG